MGSPTDRRYSDKHVWAKKEDSKATFGLTECNATKPGTVTSVSNLAAKGTNLSQGGQMGTLNRQGNTSDAFIAPLSGTVIDREEHNFDIGDVVKKPYESTSWFIRIDGVNDEEWNKLMTADKYDQLPCP